MVVDGVVVPRRRPVMICRTRSTLKSVMPSWWRVPGRFIEDIMPPISLMQRSFTRSWASSKFRWSMVGAIDCLFF